MKKLTLKTDELRVESFITSPAMQQRHDGTVKAHEATSDPGCEDTRNGCTFNMTWCAPTCAGDTCPNVTAFGALTCDDPSCVQACDITFECL